MEASTPAADVPQHAGWRYRLYKKYILFDDSRKSRIYYYVMFVCIICSIIPLMFHKDHPYFWYFDVIPCALFVFDYILRWICADYSLKKGAWSFVIYPFTFMAIVDILSILPTLQLIGPVFKSARLTRLLRIVRVFKFIRYFEPLETVMTVMRKERHTLLVVLSLALFYIFITALIMFNAETGKNPATGGPLFDSFYDAFYWSVCTLTTVGYGDIYPISELGRFISMISSLVGIAIIALPSSILTAGYLEEVRRKKSKKKHTETEVTTATNDAEKRTGGTD